MASTFSRILLSAWLRVGGATLLLGALLSSVAGASGGSAFVVGTYGGTFDVYAQDFFPPSATPTTTQRAGPFTPVTGSGAFEVRCAAERGRLRAYATTTLHNQPGFVSTMTWGTFAELNLRDLVFTGPTGATSVSASLNLRVDGDLYIQDEHAEAEMSLRIGGSGYAGPTSSRFRIGSNALTSGMFSGQPGSSLHRAFTTGTFTFAVGSASNAVNLRLDTLTTCSSNTRSIVHSTARADVHDGGNGVAFGSGPVFNLPAGWTVNSADGRIVGNRWVDPTQASISAPASHVQGCDEGTGSATVFVPFIVRVGGADLLRVRDVTRGRTLLEVSQPADGAYGIGPVTFPHGAWTLLIELLRGTDALASASVAVQIQDTVAPILAGCGPRTVEASEVLTAVSPVFLAVTATDDCDAAPFVTLAPNLLALGTTTVTATARDASGNTSACTFDVTVVDTTAPEFLVRPTGVERECAGLLTTVAFDVLATDLGAPAPVECRDQDDRLVDPAGSAFGVGEHVITCTARDGRGNEASHVFLVTILDVHAPAILCPSDAAVPTDPGSCVAHVPFVVQATDDCDPAVDPWCEAPWGPVEPGDEFPLGTTVVVARARDRSGNAASCSFSVTVRDLEPPTISAPAQITLFTDCDGRALAIDASRIGATASDNCDPLPRLDVTPTTLLPGITQVTCRATDADGNVALRAFRIQVLRGPFDVRVLRPLDPGVDNLIQPGRTVLLKVRVACENVFEPGTHVWVRSVERLDGAGSPVGNVLIDEPGGTADDGDTLRLDAQAEAYLYNLSTKDWPATPGARFRVWISAAKSGHQIASVPVVLRNR
jgi:hypothetical protein